jgi:PEP-CTERM motif-containing protein
MRPVVAFCARSLLLAGLVLLVNGRANAINFTLDVYADGVHIGYADSSRLGCVDNPDGVSAHCEVTDLPYGADYPLVNIDSINIDVDSDPVVTGVITSTNLQPTTQLFTYVFTLPVSPMASTLTGGSARGTVTDTNGDGATLSPGPGGSVYTALIDGAPYGAPPTSTQLLFGPSYFDPATPNGTDFGGPTGEKFGAPIPSYSGPGVTSSIGIQLQFYLTGFDQSSITSNHVVVVPEPHTAALLGVGLGLLAVRRRR